MSFPFLICINCDKEKNDDSFLLLGLKDEKNLNKNNLDNSNLMSNSDINANNSTNNYLEIIEYPYSLNNNQIENNNDNNISEQVYIPIKTETIKRNIIEDFDDDLLDIKPPKLFVAPNKDNKDNNQENKIVYNDKNKYKIPMENNNIINNEVNSFIKVNSNNSESYINNDNSIINNKILLTNYYKNAQNKNNNDQQNDQSNVEKDKKEIETSNINDINNSNIKNNNKFVGLKIDYPFPDTHGFYLKSNEKSPSINLPANNNDLNSNKKSLKDGENGRNRKNLFLKKMKNKVSGQKNKNKNYFFQSDFKKPKNKAKSNYNVNIDKIKANLVKEKKNARIKDIELKNKMFKKKKKLTFNSLSNFNNKYDLKFRTSNDETIMFFNQTEINKLHNSNNIFLKNIINKKINMRYKNIFKSYYEKRKITNTFNISRVANQSNIYSSKNYTNPFITPYDYLKKINI